MGVALRKESVDRNIFSLPLVSTSPKSLSARRAWIEISFPLIILYAYMSLSARRAWIEILVVWAVVRVCEVALRKESVDRNQR